MSRSGPTIGTPPMLHTADALTGLSCNHSFPPGRKYQAAKSRKHPRTGLSRRRDRGSVPLRPTCLSPPPNFNAARLFLPQLHGIRRPRPPRLLLWTGAPPGRDPTSAPQPIPPASGKAGHEFLSLVLWCNLAYLFVYHCTMEQQA